VDDIAGQRFAVVDTETTGLSTTDDKVLQLGVVIVRGDGTIEREFVTDLHRLGWGFGHVGAYAIHGITRRRLRRGMEPRTAFARLGELLEGAIFTAHNAKFDLGFLTADATRLGMQLNLYPALCTLHLSRALDPKRALSHRLHDVAQRHGCESAQLHDALADAQLAARILPKLLAELGIRTLADLRPHLLTSAAGTAQTAR
jgi:DNA polymerase-3 subunit epsilon